MVGATMFWLLCPHIARYISGREAEGLVKEWAERVEGAGHQPRPYAPQPMTSIVIISARLFPSPRSITMKMPMSSISLPLSPLSIGSNFLYTPHTLALQALSVPGGGR